MSDTWQISILGKDIKEKNPKKIGNFFWGRPPTASAHPSQSKLQVVVFLHKFFFTLSNEEMTKLKIVNLEKLYNFVVENFLIEFI